MAQVFIIETERGVRRTLVILEGTFRVSDFAALFDVQLVELLERARDGRVTLTPDGLDFRH